MRLLKGLLTFEVSHENFRMVVLLDAFNSVIELQLHVTYDLTNVESFFCRRIFNEDELTENFFFEMKEWIKENTYFESGNKEDEKIATILYEKIVSLLYNLYHAENSLSRLDFEKH